MIFSEVAKTVFSVEAKAVASLSNNLDSDFDGAIDSVLATGGDTIVCGMGKKIATTLASTGILSFFMHPGEAYSR